MRVLEIAVKFGTTANLGDYSNVRPEIELRAALEPGDDVQQALATLIAETRSSVRRLVDDELEAYGRPPHYWPGPRYDVLYSLRYRTVIVIDEDDPDAASLTHQWNFIRASGGHRHETAFDRAEKLAAGNGNLTIFTGLDQDPESRVRLRQHLDTEEERIRREQEERQRQQEEHRSWDSLSHMRQDPDSPEYVDHEEDWRAEDDEDPYEDDGEEESPF